MGGNCPEKTNDSQKENHLLFRVCAGVKNGNATFLMRKKTKQTTQKLDPGNRSSTTKVTVTLNLQLLGEKTKP